MREHDVTIETQAETPATTARARRSAVYRLISSSDLLTRLGALVLLVFVALALLGPVLPIGDPNAVEAGPRLSSPSADWWAGTDSLGRDLLPRVLQGIRTTFLLAGMSAAVTAIVSVFLGIVAAYYKGWIGEAIVRLADVLFSFPAILLAILMVAITGPGPLGASVSIVLICCPLMIRVVRASALTVVSRDFVTVARVNGVKNSRIIFVHMLPNVASAAVVQATYVLSLAMLIESGLSFLGLGLQPPQASLGSLVFEGAVYLSIAPWLVMAPGIVLALVILSVNLVGDGLRDLLDVRGTEARR